MCAFEVRIFPRQQCELILIVPNTNVANVGVNVANVDKWCFKAFSGFKIYIYVFVVYCSMAIAQNDCGLVLRVFSKPLDKNVAHDCRGDLQTAGYYSSRRCLLVVCCSHSFSFGVGA